MTDRFVESVSAAAVVAMPDSDVSHADPPSSRSVLAAMALKDGPLGGFLETAPRYALPDVVPDCDGGLWVAFDELEAEILIDHSGHVAVTLPSGVDDMGSFAVHLSQAAASRYLADTASVKNVFGLSDDELVSVAAPAGRDLTSPGPDDMDSARTAAQIASLMSRRLLPAKIKGMLRRPPAPDVVSCQPATMLQRLASGCHEAVLDEIRGMLDADPVCSERMF